MEYLIHASILISVFFLFYRYVLSSLTFFKLNRWILLGGIVLSFILPNVVIPERLSLSDTFRTNNLHLEPTLFNSENVPSNLVTKESPVHETQPAVQTFPGELAPEKKFNERNKVKNGSGNSLVGGSIIHFLPWIYIMGVVVLCVHLVFQLGWIGYIALRESGQKEGFIRIIDHSSRGSNFSFLNLIFVDSKNPSNSNMDIIIAHEKLHVQLGHSFDMIMASLLVVTQWFNPFAWSYRKAIENNLEFEVDKAMLNNGISAQNYQLNLLRLTAKNNSQHIVNHYNQSFLKKRIVMMNKQKSSSMSFWKYFILLPVIGLSMSCLNVSAQDQSNPKERIEVPQPPKPPVPPPPPAPLKRVIPSPPSPAAAPNAIKAPVPPPPPSPKAAPMPPPAPPAPVTGWSTYEYPESGDWSGQRKGKNLCLKLSHSNKSHQWNWSACDFTFDQNISSVSTSNAFRMEKDAGILVLYGSWNANKGSGKFEFEPSTEFLRHMKDLGIKEVTEVNLFHCFLGNINRPYLAYLVENNFDITGNTLSSLAVHDMDLTLLRQYVDGLKKFEISSYSLEDLIRLQIHDVEMDYVTEIISNGIRDLSVDDLIRFAIHDVDPEVIGEMKGLNISDFTTDKIIQFAIHDVDPDFVKAFASHNLNLSSDDIIQLAIHDVDEDLVETLSNSNIAGLNVEGIIQCSIHDIDEDFISELTSAGIEVKSIDELVRFSVHDVDADFIIGLMDLELESIDSDKIIQASVHDLDIEDAQSIIDLGFKGVSIDQLIDLEVHGIDTNDIQELIEKGYKDLSLAQYRDMIISNEY